MEVKILGSRGSVPVSGERFIEFGGATNCIFVRMAGEAIVFDAGTGILNLGNVLKEDEKKINLLISHPHTDHIVGLGMCPQLLNPEYQFSIYGATRNGFPIQAQLETLYKPPLWPVTLTELAPTVEYKEISEEFSIGKVRIKTIEGNHPGGVTLFRLEAGKESLVYATDNTITDSRRNEFIEFARDCDVLLIDGQYSKTDWIGTSEFGHSTWEISAHFGLECRAEKTIIIHHDAFKTDMELREAEIGASTVNPNCSFAREAAPYHTESELTERFLTLSIGISSERDREILLSKILDTAIELADCDAGTLYLKEADGLHFCRVVTKSLGLRQGGYAQEINMPTVPLDPKYVCAWSAINNRTANMYDIHGNEEFDFTGSYEYDKMIGYESKSMLVVPLTNDTNEIIGVLQLINAMDVNGLVCPFNPSVEHIIRAIAIQAAICITNVQYSTRVTKLLASVINVLSEAAETVSDEATSHELHELSQNGRIKPDILRILENRHPEKN